MSTTIDLELRADLKQATTSLQRFGSEAGSALAGVEKSFGLLKVAAGAAVGIFAGQQLIQGIRTVTAAAATQETAVTQLNTALKLSGDFSVAASKDMQAFASEIQSMSTVGDEAVLSQLALAKSFNLSNDESKKLIKSAVDLSAATGMSLDSAVINLGKSYSGLAGELGELIPAIRGMTEEQLSSGAAVEYVKERFGGAASEMTKTFGGALQQLKNLQGDLNEEIGFIITENPVIIGVFNEMGSAFKLFGDIVRENADEIRSYVNVGIRGMIDELPNFLRFVNISVQSLGILGEAFATTSDEAAKLDFTSPFETLGNTINGISFAILEAVRVILNGMEALTSSWQSTVGLLFYGKFGILDGEEPLGKAFDEAIGKIDGLQKKIADLEFDPNGGLAAGVKKSETGFERLIRLADELKGKVGSLGDSKPLIGGGNVEGGAGGGGGAGASPSGTVFGPRAPWLEPTQFPGTESWIRDREPITRPNPMGTVKEEIDQNSRAVMGFDSASAFASTVTSAIASGASSARSAMQSAEEAAFEQSTNKQLEHLDRGIESTMATIDTNLETAVGRIDGGLKLSLDRLDRRIERAVSEEEKERLEAQKNRLTNEAMIVKQRLKEEADLRKASLKSEGDERRILIKEEADARRQERATTEQSYQAAAGLLTAGATSALDMFLPGVGAALGPFLGAMAQGPAAAKEFITSLVTQIPVVIEAIAEAMPVVAETLADHAPEIITALVEGSWRFTDAIWKAQVRFTEEIIKEIAAWVLDAFGTDSFTAEGAGGGGKNRYGQSGTARVVTGVLTGGFSEFATGGMVMGSGTSDTVPAMLTPGELVIDRTTGPRLNQFIDDYEGGQGQSLVVAMLARIESLLAAPIQTTHRLEVNGRAFADLILETNRTNARTA